MAYRIQELLVENAKRIVYADVVVNGQSLVVGGNNGHGKSSTLDALLYALAGPRAMPDDPVRHGSDRMTIQVKLAGENPVEITRTQTADGKAKLVVTDSSGKVASAQAFLDGMIGSIAFDPLAFTRMEPKKQLELLKTVAGLDFSAIDAEYSKSYAERTNAGRDLEAAKARLARLQRFDNVPAEPVDASTVVTQMRQENAKFTDYNNTKAALASCQARIAEIEGDIKRLQEAKVAAEEAYARVADQLALLEPPTKTKDWDAEIKGIEETNQKVRANQAYDAAKAEVDRYQARYDSLDQSVASCRTRKEEAIKSAKMPVTGLGMSDNGVTLNGVPFEQASSAQQIQASLAMAIAANPTLRVCLIREGSLLDRPTLDAVLAYCSEHDFQVFIERVGKGEECGIIIEEGRVVGATDGLPYTIS